MSERILKALMQLFAIISRPHSELSERHKVIEGFLRKQLNKELAEEYIKIFDADYVSYQAKYKDEERYQKRTASSSVRLLVICNQINTELTQSEKMTLMVLLLSFIKSGLGDAMSTISEFEQEFVEIVAQALFITKEEFGGVMQFVMFQVEYLPASPNLLLIGNRKQADDEKRLLRENLESPIAVLHIQSVNLYICRYDGERELSLNNQPIETGQIYILNYGSSIRNALIKPVYYGDIVNSFYSSEQTPILYRADSVEYRFDKNTVGLHSLSFEAMSGTVVGIMGGSGAGKSTLLNVMTGLYKPTAGQVLLNGIDIHRQGRQIEGLIGYVTQDDLLVEELTVFQNLYFNAKLCFGQMSDNEIRCRTNEVLHDLGLYEIRELKVGSPLDKKISGGQRKRLNIALELIRQPAVLFLDEPTSGLSSRDSDNIMTLVKDLSLKGKLIFVVIHQPSSDIFKMFDRLLVLDQGGYLIYNGNPVDSILYFKSQAHQANRDTSECPECGNVNPEQVFNIVESQVLDEHGQPTDQRRISPQEWYALFQEQHLPEMPTVPRELPEGVVKRPSRLKQFLVYVKRNVFTKLSDRQYIAVCIFEAPLLALILSYIIRYYDVAHGHYNFELNENVPIYLFVAVIIAIFIGLSVSAEEIIKDRKILKRERFLNLSRTSYLASKILVLFVISAIQAALFVTVGNGVTGVTGMTLVYWLVLFSTWASANMIGLIISDAFRSVVTIYILIPFIVIPQLMLSGVLLRFEKINPTISSPATVPWYGEIIVARWAFEALAVEQFVNNDYERLVYPYEKTMSLAEFRKNYWLVEMRNKLAAVQQSLDLGKSPDRDALLLLADEIDIENLHDHQGQVEPLPFRSMMAADSVGISDELITCTKAYFDRLGRFYGALYNKASEMKNERLASIPDSVLLALKSACFNQSLADLVKNSNEIYRLVEYDHRLLQNYHQVYKDPEYSFIKAQFYAPQKKLFGRYYPTIWVNLAVIWFFNILFFFALYFRWLPKLMGVFGGKRG